MESVVPTSDGSVGSSASTSRQVSSSAASRSRRTETGPTVTPKPRADETTPRWLFMIRNLSFLSFLLTANFGRPSGIHTCLLRSHIVTEIVHCPGPANNGGERAGSLTTHDGSRQDRW